MQEVIENFVHYLGVERNASQYTIRNYTHDLSDFFRYLISKNVVSLEFVDKQVMRNYMAYLINKGIVKTSISRKISAIRTFYKYLLREDILKVSPVDNIVSPKLDKRLPAFLTIDEVRLLLKTPDLFKPTGQRDRAMLELLYAAGLRISEMVSLNLNSINLEDREITVIGKGLKERRVLIGRPAQVFLTKYLNEGRIVLLNNKVSEAIFINRFGNRIAVRRVQKIIDTYAKKIGFKRRIYPHLLRHTFATHMLDNNADLRVVQELLGHASLSTTQVYTHVSKAQSRKVYLAAHPLAKEL